MIPTDKGNKTPENILKSLTYYSYASNRDYGMTEEQLKSIGVWGKMFEEMYQNEKLN